MKWFDKWFRTKCKQAWYHGDMGMPNTSISGSLVPSTMGTSLRGTIIHGLCMTACKANGGYVLEFSHYNVNRDETVRELYVINDDDDLVESVSNTVSMYLLKNG